MTKRQQFWLFKSEPDVYSIQDLAADQVTSWEGVRNYQVRNMLRDEISVGDGVLFYHSRVNPMVIAGTAEVVRAGYPDHFAWDSSHRYFDAKCDPENPRWFMVDIKLSQIFSDPVTRDQLKSGPATAGMRVLSQGSRLSITPVSKSEWLAVHRMAGVKPV